MLFPYPYQFRDYSKFRKELPETIKSVFDKHIHKEDIEIWSSSSELVRSWKVLFQNHSKLKKHVMEFYQEPVIREYLRA